MNSLSVYWKEVLREWRKFSLRSRNYIEQRFWWIYDFTFNGLRTVLIPIREVWADVICGEDMAGVLDMRERRTEISPFYSWARPPNKTNERREQGM